MVSSASIMGMRANAAYTAAKGALLGLGRNLALEGQSHGIRVNLFGPLAGTAMARQMIEEESMHQWMTQQFPASATSAVVAWLIHEQCDVNGEFITPYGRGVGRKILSYSKGVVCDDGAFIPETARHNFPQAIDLDGAILVKSMQEVMDKIVIPRTVN